jgi:hypothetical protein
MVCITPEILNDINDYISKNSKIFKKYEEYEGYANKIEKIQTQFKRGGETRDYNEGYHSFKPLSEEEMNKIESEINNLPKIDKVTKPNKLPYFIQDVPLTDIGEKNIKIKNIQVGNIGDTIKIYAYSDLNSPLHRYYDEYVIANINTKNGGYTCNSLPRLVFKKDFYVTKLSEKSEKEVRTKLEHNTGSTGSS